VPQAVRYHADNIFSDAFLNEDYFANVSNEEASEKRIELGKLLFFDPVLSSNNQFSCATCHQPEKGFTDGLDKSLAIKEGKKIKRNAPTVVNSVYAERYFYDLREPSIERQIRHVVVDSLEFNTDFFEIVDKLSQSETYKKLFAEAYADQPQYQLSKWSISNALACYVVSLSSFNSPFDQYVRGERKELPEAAKRGFNLFMGKAACGTCHFAPSFNGLVPPFYEESESEVLGVPSTPGSENLVIDPDLGRLESSRPQDEAYFYAFSFKTPTVRNAALTAPYMHNGVYETMEEVIDFYNKGGGLGMGIDIPHQTLPDAPLNLNEGEVKDLIAFMEALTDTTGMTNIQLELPKFEGMSELNKRKPGGNY
jgi:cytochrome c peroxidase